MDWKGLQTDRPPVFLGYDRVELMLAALMRPIDAWGPEAVAGIARGGMIPATMLGCMLGLPVFTLGFDRRHGRAEWIGPQASGRVLVVDDSCSSGETLRLAREAVARTASAVATACIVHDPEVARFVPDFSHPMRDLFRLPWERGEATPAARAGRARGVVAAGFEAPFVGIGVAGASPGFDAARSVLISGGPGDAETVAGDKAEAATRSGCTHFIEGNAEQAIRIAALAPHLIVGWWNAADGRTWIVGSAAGSVPA